MMTLYDKRGCPYCWRVKKKLQELGLEEGRDYTLVDALPGTPGSKELVELGGKDQAPFLVDGEVMMYESDEIIAYLEKKFSSP